MVSLRVSVLAVCLVALQSAVALDPRELRAIHKLRSLGRLDSHRYGSRVALRRRQSNKNQPSPGPVAGTDVVGERYNECRPTSDMGVLLNAQNAADVNPAGYLLCTVRAKSMHRPDTATVLGRSQLVGQWDCERS